MDKLKNTPSLRFPEFNGEWEPKKLGELGNFIGGGTPSTSNENYWKGNIPWVSSSDIRENDLHNINIHRYLNDFAIKESATKIIPINSILLVSRVGVGKVAINKVELCTSQDFSNFIPLNCESYFIGYYLIGRKNILTNFSQGTSIKGFTTNNIKELKINLPSLPEQIKIAKFLTEVDEKIQAIKQKKSLLEQYKKGMIQQIFSQELRFKDDNNNDFVDWEEKKLREVIIEYKENSVSHNQFEVLTSSNKGLMLQKDYYSSNRLTDRENSGFNIIPNGFITYRSRSDNGTFTFNINNLGITGLISTYYPVFKIMNGDNLFFTEYLNYKKNEISKFSVGTSQRVLSLNSFNKMKLLLPCLEEQTKIANFLSTIDNKISDCHSQIEKTEVWKKGLLQQMFI